MSHFAKVENGVVTEVIVATQEEINSERHGDAFNWIQCSYNGNFRGRFPGVGTEWDKESQQFLSQEIPDGCPGEDYMWDITSSSWVNVPEGHGLVEE